MTEPPMPTETTRVVAAMRHLDQRAEGGQCAEMVAEMLAAADAVDPLRVPSAHLAGKVPLVLYFATRADADEFAAVVKDAFADTVVVVL